MVTSAASAPILDASTRGIAAPERFDYFCDALCDVYLGIRPRRTTSVDFDADVLAFSWDDLVLSRIRAPGHDARRDRHAIAAKPDDALFLNVSTTSASIVERAGRTSRMSAATPVLLDNAQPFHLQFDSSRRFTLYSLRLPRDLNGAPIDRRSVESMNDRMLHTRVGRQLTLQSRLMAAEFDAGRTASAGAMAHAVRALLDALNSPSAVETGARRIDAYRMTASSHLCETDFGVHDVAAIHRVSVRTVQSAFRASGETFTTWLLGERLDLALDRLGNPAWRHRSIEHIARSCGIADPSGFHRAFRARFGATPRAFRID